MKTQTHLKPGQKGTKRLTLYIRFRYDEEARQRLKTVELIIEKCDWTPLPPRYGANRLVSLRIEGYEMELRAQAKAAGAKWDPDKQLWFVKYGRVAGSTLEKHIRTDNNDKQK